MLRTDASTVTNATSAMNPSTSLRVLCFPMSCCWAIHDPSCSTTLECSHIRLPFTNDNALMRNRYPDRWVLLSLHSNAAFIGGRHARASANMQPPQLTSKSDEMH